MNRILSASIVALVLVFPVATFASVISLSPTSIPVIPGKVFTVRVMANPNGAHIYTVSAHISFDPALVSETGFTFAPKLLALPMSGSNVVNNTTGTLIKTAGYIPSGITSSALFGTITFKAKKAGTAHISATTKSMMLDANSKNTISGTQGSSVVVIAPTPAPKPKHVYKPAVKVVHKAPAKKEGFAHTIAVKATTTVATSTTATTTASTTSSGITVLPLSASASGGGNNTKFVLIILAIVALVIILWMNRKRFLGK